MPTNESDDTRGFTIRELVLLIYADVQDIKARYPSRVEIYSVVSIMLAVAGGVVAALQ